MSENRIEPNKDTFETIRLWTYAPGANTLPTSDFIQKFKEMLLTPIGGVMDLVWGPIIWNTGIPISITTGIPYSTSPCGEIPLTEELISKDCVCSGRDLFNFGCKCGFLKEQI